MEVLLALLFSFSNFSVPTVDIVPSVLPAASNGILNSLGLPSGTITMPGDAKLLGAQGGDWVQFLESRCSGRSCGRMKQLNPEFGQRIMKAIQAAEQQTGSKARITDSFRSIAEQAKAYQNYLNGGGLAAAPGKSYHGRGLAVDIGTAAIYNKLHQIGPQFGVLNPPKIRGRDPVHFQIGSCDAACMAKTPQSTMNDANSQPPQSGGSPGQESGGSAQGGSSPSGGSSGGGASGGSQSPQGEQDYGYSQPGTNQGVSSPVEDPAMKDLELSSITCSPEKISTAESATIEWACPSGSTGVRGGSSLASSPFSPKTALTGSQKVTPAKTVTYSILCLKSEQVITKSSCDVVVVSMTKKTPTARLKVTSHTVSSGETVDIEWSAQNVRSCTITGPGIASANISGRETSGEITEKSIFTLKCKPEKVGEKELIKTEVVNIYDDVQSSEMQSEILGDDGGGQQVELLNPLQ